MDYSDLIETGNNEEGDELEDGDESEEGEYESENDGEESEDEFGWDELDVIEELSGVQVVRCAAHTLNLAVEDTLNETNLKKVIQKFRNLAIRLRIPTIYDILKSRKLPQPKKDVETRWNSTYDMVISLKQLRSFCETENITILNQADWKMGDIFLEVFKSTKVASKLLQQTQLPLGDFFKVWLDLTLRVQKMSQCNENKVFAANLHKHLLSREEEMFRNNPTLIAALYLDPRFRRVMEKIRPQYFDVSTAQEHLLALYKQIKKVKVS